MRWPPAENPRPWDEARRLETLRALAILDTEPEADFDTLVELTADLLGFPTAFISLVDHDRQWLKARQNCALTQTERGIAFCEHTIRGDRLLVVDDAACDPRFADNPLVRNGSLRFYAGTPIHAEAADGSRQPIGSLCVIDVRPRTMNDGERRGLTKLGQLAEALIAARTTARRATETAVVADRQAADLARKDHAFRQAERMAKIGAWRIDLEKDELIWSEGMHHIYGSDPRTGSALPNSLDYYPVPSRAVVASALERAISHGEDFDVEVDFITIGGERRRVRCVGDAERRNGRSMAVFGVAQDVTDRYLLEQTLRRSADTDVLTGIANRACFDRRLEEAMARAQEDGSALLLALIDLDGFKGINDKLGHIAGDDVLRAVGDRLRAPWLAGSFAARLGGDEFALIVDDPSLCTQVDALVTRLERELRVPVHAGDLTIATAGTVGVAALDPTLSAPRDFVHAADELMYAAKRHRTGERRRAS